MGNKYEKDVLTKIVFKCLSIAQVCRELNIKPHGGNYKTLKKYFNEYNINTSHFTGKGWNVGKRYRKFCKVAELKDILIENSTYTNTSSLKKKLYDEGLKKEICEKCGIDKWCNNKITFELDHINGNNLDNRIENLRILCPNCHSQTKTWRGRKKKRSSISELKNKNYKNRNNLIFVTENIIMKM